MNLVEELIQAQPRRSGRESKIVTLFRDRPEVLDAVKQARVERQLSFRRIAEVLSQDGEYISEGAVQNWLRTEGIL
jgi:hypothetical protein